ncbi:hypothetical protein IFM89_035277 [Coptis chinensis]|uniref:F-box domain-containing protein n=1 Tax=Coptis chinensis TaxID=261450 RepID=A0A835H2I1_9MAGN|nr:hypothetical protein IFM89_035277 [Coptis chinensis]
MEPNNNEREDRLSKLPEAVLQHILSFLDMRIVYETRKLSRMFQHLWLTIHSLHFDQVFQASLTKPVPVKGSNLRFTDFVENVLKARIHNRDDNVVLFHLVWNELCDSSLFKSFINTALKLNVQDLDLQFVPKNGVFELPDNLFTSKCLKSFKLSKGVGGLKFRVHLPDNFSLPELTTLHLGFIEDSFEKFFSGCPYLETLSLEEC